MVGYEQQREEWEAQYAAAHQLWEEHKAFAAKELAAAAESAAADGQSEEAEKKPAKEEKKEEVASNYSSEATSEGALADSDQLAALREQLLNEKK